MKQRAVRREGACVDVCAYQCERGCVEVLTLDAVRLISACWPRDMGRLISNRKRDCK